MYKNLFINLKLQGAPRNKFLMS